MAIVTRDNIKTFLQITDTTQDALIDAMIPNIEQAYRKARAIPFFNFEGDITDGSQIITNIQHLTDDDYTGFENIELGLYVEVINSGVSKMRGVVIDIDQDNEEITLDSEATETLIEQTCTIYPLNAQFVCAKIYQYFSNLDNADGLKSESIGTYSRTIDTVVDGLPMAIAKMIDRYQSVQ